MPVSYKPGDTYMGEAGTGRTDVVDASKLNKFENGTYTPLAPSVQTSPVPNQNAYSPSTSPSTGTAPKVTTPVVTSQAAQDDYNLKFASYQKLVADLEAHTNAKNQAQNDAKAQAAADDLSKSKLNLEQQGIDVKKLEADTRAKAIQMSSMDGSTDGSNTEHKDSSPTELNPTENQTAVQNANTNIKTANTELGQAQTDILGQKTQAFNEFQQKVSQIMQGTFPLSATEQALINSVQMSLDRQKASVTGTLIEEAARGGQEYTPSQAAGMLANRVMDLDAMAAGTMASLKLAFQKQDYQMINDSYGKQIDYLNDKSATIQKLHDNVVAQEKDIRDQAQKVTDNINKVAQDVAKNGGTAEQVSKVMASKTEGEAIVNAGDLLQSATGTLGEYLQYKRDTLAKGLTPTDYATFKNKQLYEEETIKANAKAVADDNMTHSDKTQQKLEQQARGVLSKEFSARTGALGIENAKVNQANHLDALLKQYYDPKTGNYNVPTAQYAELVMGLATLVSPSGSAESDRAALMSKTASGDLKGAVQYVTGVPQNGNTQEIIKNLVDSIDRQAEIATRNREAALQNMRDMLPTDLEDSRKEALLKSTNMVKYEGQQRIDQKTVDTYLTTNPSDAKIISDFYKVPGATDSDIVQWLKNNGKI